MRGLSSRIHRRVDGPRVQTASKRLVRRGPSPSGSSSRSEGRAFGSRPLRFAALRKPRRLVSDNRHRDPFLTRSGYFRARLGRGRLIGTTFVYRIQGKCTAISIARKRTGCLPC